MSFYSCLYSCKMKWIDECFDLGTQVKVEIVEVIGALSDRAQQAISNCYSSTS